MPAPDPARCPRCDHRTTSVNHGPAWCPACEWNLLAYDPRRRPPPGWRLVDRLSQRLAGRLDDKLAAELSGQLPQRPTWTLKRAILLAVSALLVVGVAAIFGTGVWLVAEDPAPIRVGCGILLILLAVLLRPRLYRSPRPAKRLDEAKAPTLFALVARVAGRIGAKMPDYIVLDQNFNASVLQTGFRRRITLTIGLPLWAVLDGQARVALLAHELGHTVNGDPNRRLLVQPALATFARLGKLTRGDQSIGQVLDPDRGRRSLIVYGYVLTMWAVSRVFLIAHLALAAIGMRDHQRAEYLADQLALEVAGTDGSVRLMDTTLFARPIMRLIHDSADAEPPSRWLPLAQAYVQAHAARIPTLRQYSRRQTDLWHSHPPDGLRAQVVLSREHREPGLLVPESASQQLDRELAFAYRTWHRRMLGIREFRGPDDSPGRASASPLAEPAPG